MDSNWILVILALLCAGSLLTMLAAVWEHEPTAGAAFLGLALVFGGCILVILGLRPFLTNPEPTASITNLEPWAYLAPFVLGGLLIFGAVLWDRWGYELQERIDSYRSRRRRLRAAR